MLNVFFLNLSLQFPNTSGILGSEENVKTKRHKMFTEPEVILDIESDAHVGGLPLYVELVAGLQAKQDCGVKLCTYCLDIFPSKMSFAFYVPQ